MSKMTSESWIQLEALLEDYMGSEVDREMANAIKALAKGYAHDRAAACVAEANGAVPVEPCDCPEHESSDQCHSPEDHVGDGPCRCVYSEG